MIVRTFALLAALLCAAASAGAACTNFDSIPGYEGRLSACTYSEGGQITKSGYLSYVVVRNEISRRVRFQLEVTGSGGEKRRWTISVDPGKDQQWSIDAKHVASVAVSNYEER